MAEQKPQPEKRKPGPEEERLKIDADWNEVAQKILRKPKAEGGWSEDDDDSTADD